MCFKMTSFTEDQLAQLNEATNNIMHSFIQLQRLRVGVQLRLWCLIYVLQLIIQLDMSPLHKAAECNDVEALRQLLIDGANPNMANEVCRKEFSDYFNNFSSCRMKTYLFIWPP